MHFIFFEVNQFVLINRFFHFKPKAYHLTMSKSKIIKLILKILKQ
jgi:hypothetical protein